MKLWEYVWFQNFTDWCCKWDWWKKYMWGKSVNYEDYVRNFGEVLRDTYPPFIVKNVKAYSIINCRFGYIPYDNICQIPHCWSVPMGKHQLIWKIGDWVIADIRIFNKFWTKFCNAIFFFQFALSFKWYVIPIPYFSFNIRFSESKYFEFGAGWGAESHLDVNRVDAVFCFKFAYVNQKTSDETQWNTSDVTGFYEGSI